MMTILICQILYYLLFTFPFMEMNQNISDQGLYKTIKMKYLKIKYMGLVARIKSEKNDKKESS